MRLFDVQNSEGPDLISPDLSRHRQSGGPHYARPWDLFSVSGHEVVGSAAAVSGFFSRFLFCASFIFLSYLFSGCLVVVVGKL